MQWILAYVFTLTGIRRCSLRKCLPVGDGWAGYSHPFASKLDRLQAEATSASQRFVVC